MSKKEKKEKEKLPKEVLPTTKEGNPMPEGPPIK